MLSVTLSKIQVSGKNPWVLLDFQVWVPLLRDPVESSMLRTRETRRSLSCSSRAEHRFGSRLSPGQRALGFAHDVRRGGGVRVCSGCCSEWCHSHSILTILKAANPRARCQQGWFPQDLRLWLACGHLLAVSPSLRAHPPGVSSSYKDTGPIGLGPHPRLTLVTSLKALSQIWSPWGRRASA